MQFWLPVARCQVVTSDHLRPSRVIADEMEEGGKVVGTETNWRRLVDTVRPINPLRIPSLILFQFPVSD